jgi:hypothetical protein
MGDPFHGSRGKAEEHLRPVLEATFLAVLEKYDLDDVQQNRSRAEKEIQALLSDKAAPTGLRIISVSLRGIWNEYGRIEGRCDSSCMQSSNADSGGSSLSVSSSHAHPPS